MKTGENVISRFRLTNFGINLLFDANKEYIRKQNNDPKQDKRIRNRKSQRKSRIKDSEDQVISKILTNILDLKIDESAFDEYWKNNRQYFSPEQIYNIELFKDSYKEINDTYGGYIEDAIEDTQFDAEDEREEKIMSRPKPSYIGSFIYSYARTLMYDNILSKYLVYYTDTDSALVSVRTSRKMRHLMGGNFGQMSDDLNGSKVDSSYIVSAKSYGLFCDNKLVKGRCKGVRPRDTYLIGEYDDESHPFVADRDKVFVCDEEFYSSLCNGEKLSISCDVFKKGIGLDENGKKYFKLCHARMIKVI